MSEPDPTTTKQIRAPAADLETATDGGVRPWALDARSDIADAGRASLATSARLDRRDGR